MIYAIELVFCINFLSVTTLCPEARPNRNFAANLCSAAINRLTKKHYYSAAAAAISVSSLVVVKWEEYNAKIGEA